jgi:hypothetical protein
MSATTKIAQRTKARQIQSHSTSLLTSYVDSAQSIGNGATNAYYGQQSGVVAVQNQGPVMYVQPGVQSATYAEPSPATQPVQYAQQSSAQVFRKSIMVAQLGQV